MTFEKVLSSVSEQQEDLLEKTSSLSLEEAKSDKEEDTKVDPWDVSGKTVNLATGFPDFPPPAFICQAMADAVTGENHGLNQYTNFFGHPRLVKILSQMYSKFLNRPLDPVKNFLTTNGADQCLTIAIITHVKPGDEVIIIEPFFVVYAPLVELAGGVSVFIPLRPKGEKVSSSADWILDMEELEGKFSEKTKMIIVNTPNNPLGKVFSRAELESIAALCVKHDILILMDEVYEFMTYDDNEHFRLASFPGMFERTITMGSAGKCFLITGWRVGWLYGPEALVAPMQYLHREVLGRTNTPAQEATAVAFEQTIGKLGTEECFFKKMSDDFKAKRDLVLSYLTNSPLKPVISEGSWFVIADVRQFVKQIDISGEEEPELDSRVASWLVKEKNLQVIPMSCFYQENKKIGENYIRFCFIKSEDTLKKAESIIEML